MNEKKILAYSVLVFLVIYTLLLAVFADQLGAVSKNLPSILQLLIYYVTQTQFILILIASIYIGVINKRILGGIFGGLFISASSDAVSFPHCVLQSGFVQNAPNLTLCSDTIFIHWFDFIFPHIVSYYLYYALIPVLIYVISFELMGITSWLKEILGV